MSLRSFVAALLFFPWAELSAQYVINTIAGGGTPQGVPATSVGVGWPAGITQDNAGNIYIASGHQNQVYKIDIHGTLTTVAGNGGYGFSGDGGPALNATFRTPRGIAVDQAGSLYIADQYNYRVRKVTNGIISTIAGNGFCCGGGAGDGGPANGATLTFPSGIALDGAGALYISAQDRVSKVSNGIITTVAGGGSTFGDGGPATSANVMPAGIAVDRLGNLYIADFNNNRIRMVVNGVITTVAGNGLAQSSGDGGPPANASLWGPQWVTVDPGGTVYFSQAFDGRVRSISNGVITTAAGNGVTNYSGDNAPATSAGLSAAGVFSDGNGSLFIADGSNRLRLVKNGLITTIAGNGTLGYMGDGVAATATTLAAPSSIAVDNSGSVYIADSGNYRIRRISRGQIATVATVTQCSSIVIGSCSNVAVDET
jgi:sugar lactone lactonase YvrE